MAPVMSPVTSSGELSAICLSATLLAAPHDDDAVGDGEDVGHAVADQDDGDALVAQQADQVEHLGHLAHRDGGRRLVHQHDLGVRQPRAGDGDGLALAARHLLDQVARPGFRFQFGEDLAGAPVHRGIVEDAERADAAAQLAAEKDIRRRRQIVAQRQVLVDDLDAVLARLDRPVQDEFACRPSACVPCARAEVAGDHLDQRRLAGAVVAHQADDLAGLERERDVVDRLDGAEMLRNVGEFENCHALSLLPGSRQPLKQPCREIRQPVSSRHSDRRHLGKRRDRRQSICGRISVFCMTNRTNPLTILVCRD